MHKNEWQTFTPKTPSRNPIRRYSRSLLFIRAHLATGFCWAHPGAQSGVVNGTSLTGKPSADTEGPTHPPSPTCHLFLLHMSRSSHIFQMCPTLGNLCFYTCPSLYLKQFLPSPPGWPLLFLPVSAIISFFQEALLIPQAQVRSQGMFPQCSMLSLWQSWMHHVVRVWLPSDLLSPENKSRMVIVAGRGWSGGSCS